jgi:hypothetical protein
MGCRLVVERAIVRADHHDYGLEGKACGKRLERMGDERAPGAIEILLRPIAAEPHATASGDDQKANLIR